METFSLIQKNKICKNDNITPLENITLLNGFEDGLNYIRTSQNNGKIGYFNFV